MSGCARAILRRHPQYERGDSIWEHKRGKVWRLVESLERRNRTLAHQNRVLQARLRRLYAERSANGASTASSDADGGAA